MLAFLTQLTITSSGILLLYLLYRAYEVYHPLSIRLFLVGLSISIFAFFLDLIARLIGHITISVSLFRLYGFLAITAYVFYFAYIEFSLGNTPRLRFYLSVFIIGIAAVIRMLSSIDIEIEGGFITRSGFYYLVNGIDLATFFTIFIPIWFLFELLILSLKQFNLSTKERNKKYLKALSLVISISVFSTFIVYCLYNLGVIGVHLKSIVINSANLIAIIGLIIANYKVPTLTFIASQRTYGIFIFKESGLLVSHFGNEGLISKYINFLGGIVSALYIATDKVMNIGDLRLIVLEDKKILTRVYRDIIITMLVDEPVSIHISVLDSIINELVTMDIPDIITDDITKNINERISKYLDPLFP